MDLQKFKLTHYLDSTLMDDLLSYGDDSSLATLMEAAEDMTDDPREFARGYTSDAIDVTRRASSGTVESFTAGFYAGARYGALDVNLGAVGGGLRTDLGRTIAFPGFLDAARSSYGGTIAQGFGEAGYRFPVARGFVEPLFTAAAVHIDQDGFVEKGGAAALVGTGRSYDLGTTTLGIRSETALYAAAPIWAHAFLGWRHVFGDVRPGAFESFASGSSAFTVEGVPIDRDALSVQAGLDWKPADRFTLAALYSGQVQAGAHTIQRSTGQFRKSERAASPCRWIVVDAHGDLVGGHHGGAAQGRRRRLAPGVKAGLSIAFEDVRFGST